MKYKNKIENDKNILYTLEKIYDNNNLLKTNGYFNEFIVMN